MKQYENLGLTQLRIDLGTKQTLGLSSRDAEQGLAKYGLNTIQSNQKNPCFNIYLHH